MKKIISVLLLIFLYYCTPNKKEPDVSNYLLVNSKSNLILRDKPDMNSTIVSKISPGEYVEILELKHKEKIENLESPWAKVQYKNYEGYIFTGYTVPSYLYDMDFLIVDEFVWDEETLLKPKNSKPTDNQKLFILTKSENSIFVSNENHYGEIKTKNILKDTSQYAKAAYFNIFEILNNKKEIYLKKAKIFRYYMDIPKAEEYTGKISISHKSKYFMPSSLFDKNLDTFEYIYFFIDENRKEGYIHSSILNNEQNFSKKELSEKLLLNCMYGDQQMEKIKELINAGADVNYADPNSGITPLILAIEYKNDMTIGLLLEKGADPNKKDFQKKSFNDYYKYQEILDWD